MLNIDSNTADCFGSYNTTDVCKQCNLVVDCRYVVASINIDAYAAALDQHLHQLPEGLYDNTDSQSKIVSYLIGQLTPQPMSTKTKDNILEYNETHYRIETNSMQSVLNKIKNEANKKKGDL